MDQPQGLLLTMCFIRPIYTNSRKLVDFLNNTKSGMPDLIEVDFPGLLSSCRAAIKSLKDDHDLDADYLIVNEVSDGSLSTVRAWSKTPRASGVPVDIPFYAKKSAFRRGRR